MSEPSERFLKLVAESRGARERVRRLVAEGRWRQAEPKPDRFAGYASRLTRGMVPEGREAQQGDTLDYQPAWFLGEGAMRRRAVAYVEVVSGGEASRGTGFMISPRLFMTNQHVIGSDAAARGAQITFDRETGEDGRIAATSTFALDPDAFALFSGEEELDYAVVAVGTRTAGSAAIAEFGFCPLLDRADKHVIGMNVNIVQHPNGFPKVISIRNNILQYRTERTLLYESDTDHGSSGSPAFNDEWDLVALHHYGHPFLEKTDERGRPIPVRINEGVRISAIYRHLQDRLPDLPAPRRDLLREALGAGAQEPAAGPAGRRLSPPRSASRGEAATSPTEVPAMTQASRTDEWKLTIPIEITVRVGTTAAAQAAAPPQAPGLRAGRALTSGGEKLRVDPDYTNRPGYDADFLPGVRLPLPAPDPRRASQVAPLRAGETEAASGVLRYQHFSIVLDRSKRIALFTATNIDGETYLTVDRRTGQVSGGEGESWFVDPRVSASFQLDQTFFSNWSHLFDRGHLTRRSDPTWGGEAEAERANADTFHFTNCSPQHFRFNQSAQFWQGIERYVLEKGALQPGEGKRLCVFQGPIFNDAVDRWADDVQIPSSYFKIVAWKGRGGLKSVGLVADQLALLDEERRNLGEPRDPPAVDVRHWRVAIETIGARTGLSFGSDLVAADTIAQGDQPRVGEKQIEVRSFADIPVA